MLILVLRLCVTFDSVLLNHGAFFLNTFPFSLNGLKSYAALEQNIQNCESMRFTFRYFDFTDILIILSQMCGMSI